MKAWKKLVVTAASLALVLTAVTACGGGASTAAGGKTIAAIKQRGVLRVGVKADVLGFGYKNPDTGKFEGLEIDIAKAVAKKILGDENKIEFTPVTAKTRVGLLDSGQLDMVAATFTVTDERKKILDFSPIYYTDGIQLLVLKDSGIKSLKDMDGKTIAVAKGADTGKRVQDKAKALGISINTAEFDTYPQALAALDAKQVQAMATDGSILKSYEAQDKNTVLLPDRYSDEPYGIATKKGNDDLAKVIAGVIDDMKKSGTLNKLIQKYGLSGSSGS